MARRLVPVCRSLFRGDWPMPTETDNGRHRSDLDGRSIPIRMAELVEKLHGSPTARCPKWPSLFAPTGRPSEMAKRCLFLATRW